VTRIFPRGVVRTFTVAFAATDADASTAAIAAVPTSTDSTAETIISCFLNVPSFVQVIDWRYGGSLATDVAPT
jgi:hypothetical protein